MFSGKWKISRCHWQCDQNHTSYKKCSVVLLLILLHLVRTHHYFHSRQPTDNTEHSKWLWWWRGRQPMRYEWEGLTSGGLCPEQVWVGGDLVLWVGLQHGVGGAAVQQGHLTLPYGRRGWMERGGWGRSRSRGQEAGGGGGGRERTAWGMDREKEETNLFWSCDMTYGRYQHTTDNIYSFTTRRLHWITKHIDKWYQCSQVIMHPLMWSTVLEWQCLKSVWYVL